MGEWASACIPSGSILSAEGQFDRTAQGARNATHLEDLQRSDEPVHRHFHMDGVAVSGEKRVWTLEDRDLPSRMGGSIHAEAVAPHPLRVSQQAAMLNRVSRAQSNLTE